MYLVFMFENIDVWWVSLSICIVCTYVIVFSGGTAQNETRKITREYILNLHDNSVGELFVPSMYPTYKKERSGSDGNDYMSPTGGIICTKFVTENQTVQVKSNILIDHVYCVLIIAFAFIVWSNFKSPFDVLEYLMMKIQTILSKLTYLENSVFTAAKNNSVNNSQDIIRSMQMMLSRTVFNIGEFISFMIKIF